MLRAAGAGAAGAAAGGAGSGGAGSGGTALFGCVSSHLNRGRLMMKRT